MNILDYLKQHESLLYESVQYTVIEISPSLANKLSARIKIPNREGNVHEHCIRIVNADILEWDQVVPEPCFFIAMEVIVSVNNHV